MSDPVIDQLTSKDEPAAVASLAAAFAAYPLFPPLCPRSEQRPQLIAAFCRMLFRMSVPCGGVFATTDRAAVACVWPPGWEWPSSWLFARGGGLALLWQLGWRGSRMLSRFERVFDAARVKYVPGPHWYLPLLGVRPEMQGKGLSRAVMRPIFEAADRDRLPVYLETMPETNVPLYRKLGFELLGRSELPGGLPNWEMVRSPQ